MLMRHIRLAALVAILTLLALGGCASVPETIRRAPPGDVPPDEVRAAPQQYLGVTVRWGGSIVKVHNRQTETLIEIVARRLDSQGRPRAEDRSLGRFLAKVAGFLDPAIYAAGREVTVRGQFEGMVEQPIGEFRYLYPIVRAEHVQLWPPRREPDYPYYYDPFWYDPWYPWGWPYHPYPYYRPWYR